MLIAVGVVVSHGLVNRAPLLPSGAPAPGPSLDSRNFLLAVVLLDVPCGIALGRHKVVARNMFCLVTVITNN